ncbi:DUF4276 family protein [Butyrivibrio sp. AC2005]|uniref:DUF4276 family protein n=1 Tax=Butyrivibrio sp. AC2005 TaxID=1280672 RepID=UPI00041F1694|nr:DUF4276 family protein [Butyrivibrio sp. AC2005]
METEIVIAVTGEGETDYGSEKYNKKKAYNEWKWGPIAEYINAIAAEKEKVIKLVPIDRRDVEAIRLGRNAMGLVGKSIPAKKFTNLMQEKDLKVGIYYCDTDKKSGSKNDKKTAQKENEQVHAEVTKGLESDNIKAIPMVPLRMIESWIMGDIPAIEKTLDITIPDKLRPKDPELLWGDKEDPKSNYPKNYLDRMIQNSDKKCKAYKSSKDIFVEFAQNAELCNLRNNCSISFERFYKEFVEMLG